MMEVLDAAARALPAPDADAQTIYDFVACHLLTQGKATSNGVVCHYRAPGSGLMCAAGCLIPDEMYRDAMENHLAPYLRERFPQLPEYFDSHAGLIGNLQQIHDKTPMENWPAAISALGAAYGLRPYTAHHGARAAATPTKEI